MDDDGYTLPEAFILILKRDFLKDWARYWELAAVIGQSRLSPEADVQNHFNPTKFYMQRFAQNAQVEEELLRLRLLFRDRFSSFIREGQCTVSGVDSNLERKTVPSEMISSKSLLFDSNQLSLRLGRFTLQAVRVKFVHHDSSPGPKPGRPSPKVIACEAALGILNSDNERPEKRRGWKTELARKVREKLRSQGGPKYLENTIAGMIRDTVTEWEKANPNK